LSGQRDRGQAGKPEAKVPKRPAIRGRSPQPRNMSRVGEKAKHLMWQVNPENPGEDSGTPGGYRNLERRPKKIGGGERTAGSGTVFLGFDIGGNRPSQVEMGLCEGGESPAPKRGRCVPQVMTHSPDKDSTAPLTVLKKRFTMERRKGDRPPKRRSNPST